jgi:hypothetical protein
MFFLSSCCLSDYYYDRNTGMSSWVPPRLLRSWDVDKLEYLTENPQRTVWACKNYIARCVHTHMHMNAQSITVTCGSVF